MLHGEICVEVKEDRYKKWNVFVWKWTWWSHWLFCV